MSPVKKSPLSVQSTPNEMINIFKGFKKKISTFDSSLGSGTLFKNSSSRVGIPDLVSFFLLLKASCASCIAVSIIFKLSPVFEFYFDQAAFHLFSLLLVLFFFL